jgi:DNA-binding HxlR family transcriptional regulator
MRSYGQYCAISRSLDLIGDRWNLLIVRELLVRGPSRYTDLQYGLPGIATNLLADRLRQLEAGGLVEREDAPAPIATTLFRLTARGEALRGMLSELVRWGADLMVEEPGDDAFRGHWLAMPAEVYLAGSADRDPPVTLELRAGDEPWTVEVGGGSVTTRPGAGEEPDLVLEAEPRLILGVLAGKLSLAEAAALGLAYEGDPEAVLPAAAPSSAS